MLIGLVAVYSWYFYVVADAPDLPRPAALAVFFVATIGLIIIQIVLHTVAALMNPGDAAQQSDERDNLIALRATRVSSVVLGVGVFMSASLCLTEVSTLTMANAILLSTVLAEITQCIVQLSLYRSGI